MKRKKLFLLIAIIFTVVVITAAVTATAVINLRGKETGTLPANNYEVFIIEGMPCVRVYRIDGISCDWSKWDGR